MTAALLDQHVLACPACGSTAAAHVGFEESEPTVIRVVCANGCPDTDSLRVRVIDLLYPAAAVA